MIYVGQELDAWLDNDDHLEQWEENTLTASDRRILLANWYNTAVKRALEGQAKLKYFEHAGCLLTAQMARTTTWSRLEVKFEGTPPGYKLTVPNEYLYINLFSLIVRIN